MMDATNIAFLIFIILLFVGFLVEQIAIILNAVGKTTVNIAKLVEDKKIALYYGISMSVLFVLSIFLGAFGNGKQAFEVLMY